MTDRSAAALTDDMLDEYREDAVHGSGAHYDRTDVARLVNEVDRLRALRPEARAERLRELLALHGPVGPDDRQHCAVCGVPDSWPCETWTLLAAMYEPSPESTGRLAAELGFSPTMVERIVEHRRTALESSRWEADRSEAVAARWLPPSEERVPINIHPDARDALCRLLVDDPRFFGVGYSEFVMRAVLAALRPEREGKGTICQCGLAKDYHDPRYRPVNFVEHEYEPRLRPEREGLREALFCGWCGDWNALDEIVGHLASEGRLIPALAEPSVPSIDAAWAAAEAALPGDDWDLSLYRLGREPPLRASRRLYAATAASPHDPVTRSWRLVSSEEGRERDEKQDPTPAAALLALAERLGSE